MANSITNTCLILRQHITPTSPSSDASRSPLIAVANADVVVSLHPDGSHDLHLTSAMLMRTSQLFHGALSDERVEVKTTGFVDPGNGSRRAMKRFELEFFENGEYLLVGKVEVTDEATRAGAYHDGLVSETYRQHFERERWQLLNCSTRVSYRSDRPPPDEKKDVDASEMDVLVFVNTLGFTMLCGFSTKGLVRSSGLLFLTRKQSRRRFKAYIVQRLVEWIDFYGVLESVRWQLIDWIMTFASSGAFRDTDFRDSPIYLRIATALRDREFFEWVLNKNPFFNCEAQYHLSSIDCALGLRAWAPVFDRYVIHETDLQLSLQHVDQRGWIDSRSNDIELRATTRCYWQLMVARSYFTYSSAEKGLWPVLSVLDKFFNDIPADSEDTSVERGWRRTDVYRNIWTNWEHTVRYPLRGLSAQDKAQLIEQVNVWINMAQELILKFLTPAPEEPYRLKLVLGGFWKRHGFPWDYCDKGKSEGGLFMFSLIANQDLTEFKKDLCHFQKSADA